MVRRLEISVDRETCISNALCTMTAPDHFELDATNRARATDSPAAASERLWEAIRGCPVGAIRAVDAETGEQLYPEG